MATEGWTSRTGSTSSISSSRAARNPAALESAALFRTGEPNFRPAAAFGERGGRPRSAEEAEVQDMDDVGHVDLTVGVGVGGCPAAARTGAEKNGVDDPHRVGQVDLGIAVGVAADEVQAHGGWTGRPGDH